MGEKVEMSKIVQSLVVTLVKSLAVQEGCILVFVPGLFDIVTLQVSSQRGKHQCVPG